MARTPIDVTPNPGGDSGIQGGTTCNNNFLLDDALQAAVGVDEGTTTIGEAADVGGATASAEADNIKQRLAKIDNRTASMAVTRHSGDASRTSRDLGQDYDLDSIAEGTVGTTFITSGGAVSSQYPVDNVLFEVDTRRSGAVNGTAFGVGALLVVTLTAEIDEATHVWVATQYVGASRSPWTQIAPTAALTQGDSLRTTRTLADNADWLSNVASGHYLVTFSAGNVAGDDMPVASSTSAVDLTWSIQLLYHSTTSGTVTASATYDAGFGSKIHVWQTPVTKSGGANAWAAPTGWVALTGEDIAARTIRPRQLLDNQWTLTQPAGLDATFIGLPQYDRGQATCTVTAKELREQLVVGAGTYYVDVNQASTGTGTAGSPYLTIGEALANADCGTIYIAPGHYPWTDNMSFTGTTWGFSGNLIVRKWPGTEPTARVFLTSHQTRGDGSWTLEGGTTNVYTLDTQSDSPAVIDPRYYDARTQSFLRYTEVGSVAEVDLLPGSVYFGPDAGGNNWPVYVHTPDSTQPAIGDLFVLRSVRAAGEVSSTPRTLYMEGLTCIGGNEGIRHENDSGVAGGRFIGKDLECVNCGTQGIRVQGVTDALLEDCTCNNNRADGFYYIEEGLLQTAATEVNCRSQWNGAGNGNSVNGSSAHTNCRVLRIGGKYNHNEGPNIADIDTVKCWNVECDMSDSASSPLNANYQQQDAGYFARDTVQMWIHGGRSLGNQGDVSPLGSSIVRHSEVRFKTTNVSGSGTLEEYVQL